MSAARDLTALFGPKSVAVLGASNDETKYRNWLSVQAVRMTDARTVHLINRRGESILGRPALRSLAEHENQPLFVTPEGALGLDARIVLESYSLTTSRKELQHHGIRLYPAAGRAQGPGPRADREDHGVRE